MNLMQHVETGFRPEGREIVVEYRQSYLVDSVNRDRIVAREKGRGTWEGDTLIFPTHPSVPELSEYITRIRWETA